MMNIFRLPVQVNSGCHASSRIMRSEAIPLEVFGQLKHTFNASSTAFAGHQASANGEPFDSCVNCPILLSRAERVWQSMKINFIIPAYGNGGR